MNTRTDTDPLSIPDDLAPFWQPLDPERDAGLFAQETVHVHYVRADGSLSEEAVQSRVYVASDRWARAEVTRDPQWSRWLARHARYALPFEALALDGLDAVRVNGQPLTYAEQSRATEALRAEHERQRAALPHDPEGLRFENAVRAKRTEYTSAMLRQTWHETVGLPRARAAKAAHNAEQLRAEVEQQQRQVEALRAAQRATEGTAAEAAALAAGYRRQAAEARAEAEAHRSGTVPQQ